MKKIKEPVQMKNPKRPILLLLIVILFFAPVLNAGDFTRALVILQGEVIKKNSNELLSVISNLDGSDRATLYFQLKKGFVGATALNCLTGFGVGSFVQKDKVGGRIGLSLDLASILSIAAGFGIQAIVSSVYLTGQTYTVGHDNNSLDNWSCGTGGWFLNTTGPASVIGIALGVTVYIISKVYQFVRPLYYANTFNDNLVRLLLTDGRLGIRF